MVISPSVFYFSYFNLRPNICKSEYLNTHFSPIKLFKIKRIKAV